MFTGIVAETGAIADVTDAADGRRVRVSGEAVTDDLEHGQSVSVSGVCLTVEEHGDDWFEVFLARETVEKTSLDALEPGDAVNLELAVRADDRLDGHIVQGHVDATAELVDVRSIGEDGAASHAADAPSGEQPRGGWEFEWSTPDGYGQYVAAKGSVALDGVSLTVAERDEATFTTAIIPTTYETTNFSEKEPGDLANLEVDVVAKYAERLLAGE